MGAYLTKPNTDKNAEDGKYGKLNFGSCSMQGWRVSQEDAHNCLPEFDSENQTALFAVYDGHGGAEVAKYCALELPNYLVALPSYQDEKDLSKALTETFLGFDATLLEERTIEKLRQLSDSGKEEPRMDEDEEDEEDATMLKEEASLPLENVLEKYGGIEALPPVLKTLMMYRKKQEFKSPCIAGKRRKPTADAGCSGDDVEEVPMSIVSSSKITDSDSTVSVEMACGSSTDDLVDENVLAKAAENGLGEDNEREKKDTVQNGEIFDDKIKENGIDDNSHENGVDVNASSETLTSSSITSIKEKFKENIVDEDDDDWKEDHEKAENSDEDEEEDEEDEDEEEDSGVDEDDDEEDDDEDDDDDDEDDEVDDENAVLSFGQQMDDSEPGVDSGTTAVVALIRDRSLVVANAGDSRCVLCRDGLAVDLSVDHKPEDQPEKERIAKAGGVVTQEGRVNGGLNLSRAVGDHSYKKNDDLGPSEQMITALPDIQSIELDPEKDEFIVLACDGIWNSLNSQEVVDYVKERLTKDKEMKLSDICSQLFDSCLAEDTVGDGTGCDNMTCVLVRFDWHASEPTPTVGKYVKGVKRSEPPSDITDGDDHQTAKKSRLDSD